MPPGETPNHPRAANTVPGRHGGCDCDRFPAPLRPRGIEGLSEQGAVAREEEVPRRVGVVQPARCDLPPLRGRIERGHVETRVLRLAGADHEEEPTAVGQELGYVVAVLAARGVEAS